MTDVLNKIFAAEPRVVCPSREDFEKRFQSKYKWVLFTRDLSGPYVDQTCEDVFLGYCLAHGVEPRNL